MAVSSPPARSQTGMAVRRRDPAERRILQLVRGGGQSLGRRAGDAPGGDPFLTPAQLACFSELGQLAIEQGMEIQRPEAPYVSPDELLLLGWLAQAQRAAALVLALPTYPVLQAAILESAALLNTIGWWLPPLTLYGARARAGAQQTRRIPPAE